MVHVSAADGRPPLPGLAPVAMQQGRYAARLVRARLRGRDHGPFRYVDKGNLATIGRSKAVADVKGVHLSGFPAWATWLLVHIVYLIGFQNRALVLLRWTVSFVTRGRGARLIVPSRADAARLGGGPVHAQGGASPPGRAGRRVRLGGPGGRSPGGSRPR
jgi:NADH:ubiquinone reductase (H+-translocating)